MRTIILLHKSKDLSAILIVGLSFLLTTSIFAQRVIFEDNFDDGSNLASNWNVTARQCPADDPLGHIMIVDNKLEWYDIEGRCCPNGNTGINNNIVESRPIRLGDACAVNIYIEYGGEALVNGFECPGGGTSTQDNCQFFGGQDQFSFQYSFDQRNWVTFFTFCEENVTRVDDEYLTAAIPVTSGNIFIQIIGGVQAQDERFWLDKIEIREAELSDPPTIDNFTSCLDEPSKPLPTSQDGVVGTWRDPSGTVVSSYNPSVLGVGEHFFTFVPDLGCYDESLLISRITIEDCSCPFFRLDLVEATCLDPSDVDDRLTYQQRVIYDVVGSGSENFEWRVIDLETGVEEQSGIGTLADGLVEFTIPGFNADGSVFRGQFSARYIGADTAECLARNGNLLETPIPFIDESTNPMCRIPSDATVTDIRCVDNGTSIQSDDSLVFDLLVDKDGLEGSFFLVAQSATDGRQLSVSPTEISYGEPTVVRINTGGGAIVPELSTIDQGGNLVTVNGLNGVTLTNPALTTVELDRSPPFFAVAAARCNSSASEVSLDLAVLSTYDPTGALDLAFNDVLYDGTYTLEILDYDGSLSRTTGTLTTITGSATPNYEPLTISSAGGAPIPDEITLLVSNTASSTSCPRQVVVATGCSNMPDSSCTLEVTIEDTTMTCPDRGEIIYRISGLDSLLVVELNNVTLSDTDYQLNTSTDGDTLLSITNLRSGRYELRIMDRDSCDDLAVVVLPDCPDDTIGSCELKLLQSDVDTPCNGMPGAIHLVFSHRDTGVVVYLNGQELADTAYTLSETVMDTVKMDIPLLDSGSYEVEVRSILDSSCLFSVILEVPWCTAPVDTMSMGECGLVLSLDDTIHTCTNTGALIVDVSGLDSILPGGVFLNGTELSLGQYEINVVGSDTLLSIDSLTRGFYSLVVWNGRDTSCTDTLSHELTEGVSAFDINVSIAVDCEVVEYNFNPSGQTENLIYTIFRSSRQRVDTVSVSNQLSGLEDQEIFIFSAIDTVTLCEQTFIDTIAIGSSVRFDGDIEVVCDSTDYVVRLNFDIVEDGFTPDVFRLFSDDGLLDTILSSADRPYRIALPDGYSGGTISIEDTLQECPVSRVVDSVPLCEPVCNMEMADGGTVTAVCDFIGTSALQFQIDLDIVSPGPGTSFDATSTIEGLQIPRRMYDAGLPILISATSHGLDIGDTIIFRDAQYPSCTDTVIIDSIQSDCCTGYLSSVLGFDIDTATCNDDNGSINFNLQRSASFTVDWSDDRFDGEFSAENLAPGEYQVDFTHTVCGDTSLSIEVPERDSFELSAVVINEPNGSGLSDGAIRILCLDCTQPYVLTINGEDTIVNASFINIQNLDPGDYEIIYFNPNTLCRDTIFQSLGQTNCPENLSISLNDNLSEICRGQVVVNIDSPTLDLSTVVFMVGDDTLQSPDIRNDNEWWLTGLEDGQFTLSIWSQDFTACADSISLDVDVLTIDSLVIRRPLSCTETALVLVASPDSTNPQNILAWTNEGVGPEIVSGSWSEVELSTGGDYEFFIQTRNGCISDTARISIMGVDTLALVFADTVLPTAEGNYMDGEVTILCDGCTDGRFELFIDDVSAGIHQSPYRLTNIDTTRRKYTLVDTATGCSSSSVFIHFSPCLLSSGDVNVQIEHEDPTCTEPTGGTITISGLSNTAQVSIDGTMTTDTVFVDLESGDYRIEIIDTADPCFSRIDTTILLAMPYTHPMSGFVDTTILSGDSIRLSTVIPMLDSSVNYYWSENGNALCVSMRCATVLVSPSQRTTYKFIIDHPEVCNADSLCVIVDVGQLITGNEIVDYPNILSISDNSNSVFLIANLHPQVIYTELVSFHVYARNGGLIHQDNGIGRTIGSNFVTTFDAQTNSRIVPNEVYTFVAELRSQDGSVDRYSGTITIVQ